MSSGRPPVWKQILGAVIGGTMGLLVYTGYQSGKPVVTAWLTIPQSTLVDPSDEGTNTAHRTLDAKKEERLQARAREIEEQFAQNYKKYQVEQGQEHAAEEQTLPPDSPTQIASADAQWDGWSETGTVEAWSDTGAADKPSAPAIDAGQPTSYVDTGKGKAPQLPDSGLGLWAGLSAALAGALGMRYRCRF